jgi:23S rRNA (guanosine2251-2'-O)-methyltransferase
MERHHRGKGKKRLLGSHQKCWIWGRNAIVETLAAGRWEIKELYLSRLLSPEPLAQAQALAARQRIIPVMAEPDELTRLCHTSEHQGYLARMTDFPYADEAVVMSALPTAPFCVILDGVQDPYNFGAIVRSGEIFGVNAIFIAESGQVGVTSMVVRSSAGAVNRVPIVKVPDLHDLVVRLKARGIKVVAASEKAACPIMDYPFKQGISIVIGNEGVGPGAALLQHCDDIVSIPQTGRIDSLNAAVAAGIFFYEVRRQRR